MKETVQLLKKQGVQLEFDLLLKIENTKTSFTEVAEKSLGPIKEQILPLQTKESANIKKQLDKFSSKVIEFRNVFLQKCPYHPKEVSDQIIEDAYNSISHFFEQTVMLDDEAKKYNNLETLKEKSFLLEF